MQAESKTVETLRMGTTDVCYVTAEKRTLGTAKHVFQEFF